MKNEDNRCFIWCVLRALYPVKKDKNRLDKTLKSKIETLNTTGIRYPVSLPDIKKFECLNSNISITVFGYNEKDKVFPLRMSEHSNRFYKIKLLLVGKGGVSHYCLIENFSRLVSSQVSKHKEKSFLCERCLNPFPNEESLNKHEEYCSNNECVKTNMLENGSMLIFNNHYKSEKVPFMIYADTESLIKSLQTCEPSPQGSYTKKYQKHEPISFSYYIKCFDDIVFKPNKLRSYTGDGAMQNFVEWLEEDIKIIANIPEVDMIFGKEEAERLNKETKCWICKGDLNDDRVRDHCHFTGRYRGAAHN